MKRSRDEAEPSAGPTAASSLDEPVGPFKSTGDVDEEGGVEDVEESNECIICFGELKVVGQLSSCSHTCFCYDCILEWSKTENRCPCCRKRFTTLAKVDREAEGGGSGKGKARKKPAPPKVKIPSRDQGAAYAARIGGGLQWDPFGHDTFFQIGGVRPFPPFAAPRSDRRRADRFDFSMSADAFVPELQHFVDMELMNMDALGRRPSGGGGGNLRFMQRETEVRGGSNRGSSNPGEDRRNNTRRAVEHVIEFSHRIRYTPSHLSSAGHSRVARGGAGAAAAAGPRNGPPSSTAGGGSNGSRPTSAMAGTALDPVVLDDESDGSDEVRVVSNVPRPSTPHPPGNLSGNPFMYPFLAHADASEFSLDTPSMVEEIFDLLADIPTFDGAVPYAAAPAQFPRFFRRPPPQPSASGGAAARGGAAYNAPAAVGATSRGASSRAVGSRPMPMEGQRGRRVYGDEVIVLESDEDNEMTSDNTHNNNHLSGGGGDGGRKRRRMRR